MGASEARRDTSAGCLQTVGLLSCAVLCGLRAACGRTGAVGGNPCVARRSAGPWQGSQLVSTKPLGEVHTRMTTCIGTPQVGQRAASGCGGLCCGSVSSLGCPCPISRRRVAGGMAQLAWRKPQGRTVTKPSGKTGWRTRRRHSMTSRWAVRGRALPTFREVKVPVRSVSETMRLLAMATRKTSGAREVQAEWPWGGA